jgi:hypothetical protein
MARHLEACPQRRQVLQQTDLKGGEKETLYHLRAEDAYGGDFWLHLEMRGSASLKTLDSYLRAIWLECCGHLSQFTIGGWGGRKVGMARKAEQVFQPDVVLTHQYDFGTTSETLVKFVAVRTGKPTTRHPITLMARNNMPEAECAECGQPAGWLCMECLIEEDEWRMFCARHAEEHPHREYGDPLALVNSPRLGMCGYTGPADPPY